MASADPDFDQPELDQLYDDGTLRLLDRDRDPSLRIRSGVEVARGWRSGLGAGAIAVAALAGVQDALEPERRDPIIEEIDLGDLVDDRAPVVYHHVPGAPRASRAVVRPWLL